MSTHEEIIDNLPSMDDFEEGSSLIIEEEIDDPKPADPPPGETVEEKEARESQEAEEAEEAERQRVADQEAEEEAERKKKEDEAAAAEKAKPKTKKSGDTEEEEDEDGSDKFYESVTNLHGIELEVEYGDTDPLTPEGVALREQTLAEAAINSQMEYLAKQYPKEFKVLEHAVNGGSVDDLFKPGYLDYSKIELEEENIEQHKKILKDYYLDTGISDKKAELLVEADEDAEGGTLKAAQEVLKDRIKQQEEKEADILKEQQKAADKVKAQDDQMRKAVNEITTSGKVGNFQVPKADQDNFYQYALSNVRRNGDGTYSFVVPLDEKNLDTTLQQAYFSYKKGDLSKLVAIKASTQNAQRLKTKVKGQSKKLKTSEAQQRKEEDGKLGTLADFTVE